MASAGTWSREETLFALHLMLKVPFCKVHGRNEEIIVASELLGSRTPDSVKMKVFNLFSCLPEPVRGNPVGLVRASKMDEEIVAEYLRDPERIMIESTKVAAQYYSRGGKIFPYVKDALSLASTENVAWLAEGISRTLFREKLLSTYDSRCCVTGLANEDFLSAIHIKSWGHSDHAERIASSNGLLLNSLHNKAFGEGLITVTDDRQVLLSPRIRGVFPKSDTEDFFEAYENKAIRVPSSDVDAPNSAFLKWHRENVFQKSC